MRITHFVNERSLPQQFFATPLRKHGEFQSHQANFTSPTPDDSWCSTERYQFIKFLPIRIMSVGGSFEIPERYPQPNSVVDIVQRKPHPHLRVASEGRSTKAAQWPKRGRHAGYHFCQSGCSGRFPNHGEVDAKCLSRANTKRLGNRNEVVEVGRIKRSDTRISPTILST
jgi:hypothetical protein